MGTRTNRDQVAGDIQTETATDLVNAGKAVSYQVFVQMRQIEIDVGMLGAFHAADDGLGHDVTGSQFGPGIDVEHEAIEVLVAQIGPFAANRLADEKATGPGHVEHRGMELHEFHVPQHHAGPIRGRHAVSGGQGRIGRFAINHSGAARSQDNLLGPDEHLAVTRLEGQHAHAPAFMGQQIENEGVVPEGDVGQFFGAGDDGPHHFEARGVAQGVDDPAMTVPSFARQGQMSFFLIEVCAPANQVVDLFGRLAHHHLDNVAMAQIAPRLDGVLDMVFKPILGRHHSRDAALGVGTGTLAQRILGQDKHLKGGRNLQHGPHPGDARAEHDNVGEDVRCPLGLK